MLPKIAVYQNSILATCLVFIFFLYPSGDADLGWHLRYGESFINSGRLLTQNLFSFTLPDYQWVNHSWLYDPVAALIFKYTGFAGLSVSGALLIAVSFFLVTKRLGGLALILAVIIFVYFGQFLLAIGLRSQLLSLVFTAYLWSRLTDLQKKPDRFYDLIFLFLIWANFHGQYLMGLGILWLYLIGYFFDRTAVKTARYHLLTIAFASTLVTLLNPYGYRLVLSAFEHLRSPITKNIFEWMPWELYSVRSLVLIVYGFLTLKLAAGKLSRRWSYILVYLILFILSLKARRMIPYFILVTISPAAHYLAGRFKHIIGLSRNQTSWLIISFIFLTGIILVPSRQIFRQTWSTYCQSNVLCSEPLAEFFRDHPPQGNILNAYRLGGHLIYRSPQAPVFIDGRMTLWQDGDDHYLFQDYLDMIHARPNAIALLDRYQIRYVVAHPEFELISLLKNRLNWSLIYEDPILRVYRSPLID